MFLGGFVSLVAMAGIAGLVLLVMALVDIARRPAAAWEEADQNQIVWVLIVVLVGFIGPLLYLVIARPALDAAQRREPAPVDR